MTKARVNDWWVSGFTADTPVLMADGNTKPISAIKEGELVMSFDPVTKQAEMGLVTGTFASVMNDLVSVKADGKSEMMVAGKQRFFTPAGEFKTASDAEAIMTKEGNAKNFTSKKIAGKAKIYDITVMPNHAFYADGLAVHNGGGGGGSKAPPPPPDPVVTAGKVGQPLTVNVNGSTITAGAQPESAAQVSVAYNGTVNTRYNTVPGLPRGRPVLPPIKFIHPRNFFDASVKTQAAIDTETTVCASMKGTSGSISAATKNGWTQQLDTLKKQTLDAQKAANIPWAMPMNATAYSDGQRYGGGDPITGFGAVLNDVAELRKFIQKNRNLTARDNDFISGKCANIDQQLTNIKATLDSRIKVYPIDDKLPVGRIYENQPEAAYYFPTGDGESYYFQPPGGPGATPLGIPGYYRRFDESRALYYFTRDRSTRELILL